MTTFPSPPRPCLVAADPLLRAPRLFASYQEIAEHYGPETPIVREALAIFATGFATLGIWVIPHPDTVSR